jgi:hypothetical protein
MLSQKITFFFLFLLLGFHCLRADFFACLKLEHPIAKKKIYLFYDIHSSVIADSDLDKSLLDQIYKINKDWAQLQPLVKLINYKENLNKILIKFSEWRNNLPNLVKQHNDLANLVKNFGISIISEDWFDPEGSFELNSFHPNCLLKLIYRLIGKEKNYKNSIFRIGVSPLFQIGKTVTGKFTVNTFVPIGKAYFYNPDDRGGNQINNSKVDDSILKAIDKLFTDYNQTKVIVAAGCSHITKIAHELVKNGYISSNLIVNKKLNEVRLSSKPINDFLNNIEKNNCNLSNLDDESIYKLISNPLDLQQLFVIKKVTYVD